MDRQRYLDWLLLTTSAEVRSWMGDDNLLSSLGDDFSQTIADRMNSPEWAKGYARACPCDGAAAEDYSLRELRLPGDLSLLAGIHFYGSKRLFPFVGVYAQTREITRGELRWVTNFLIGEFAGFEPTCVQIWSGGRAAEFRQLEDLRVTGDCRLLVGNLAELIAGAPPPEPPSQVGAISLEAPKGSDWFENYREIYREFFKDNPQWRGRLEIESCESLEECADCGGLFEILVDGELAGLIAARPECYRGVSGWLMVDEILARPFRGRGLAPTIQRRFLERLDPVTCKLIIGTIDDENEPSLRTAMRNGRIDAGGQVFVYP